MDLDGVEANIQDLGRIADLEANGLLPSWPNAFEYSLYHSFRYLKRIWWLKVKWWIKAKLGRPYPGPTVTQ